MVLTLNDVPVHVVLTLPNDEGGVGDTAHPVPVVFFFPLISPTFFYLTRHVFMLV